MVVLGVDAPFFFRPVANAEVDPMVLPFRDRHARGDFLRLQLGIERLDVDELKQLHAIQPALRFLDNAAPIEIAWLEGELALDDVQVARIDAAGNVGPWTTLAPFPGARYAHRVIEALER